MALIQWLASYPKSGNTWLRFLLDSVRRGGEPIPFPTPETPNQIASARSPFDELLGIESSDLTEDEIERLRPLLYRLQAARSEEPSLRKVHDAWTLTSDGTPLFPPDVTDGVIYIVRDPRDVAASMANHNGVDLDRAITQMGNPDQIIARSRRQMSAQFPQRLMTWGGHVESWLDASGARLMLVRYEDMIADTEDVLAAAVRFLGRTASAEVIARSVAANSFERLRAGEAEAGFVERPKKSAAFFRRGEAGGWRDELTPEQVIRIETDHGAVMRRLGYL
ncbi:MAG: sulfotransferase domain-containing protein [Pseudomonadota bacterium]|nr:sulfotransferase domain-containing protein [Pseudomonadota bacterium]